MAGEFCRKTRHGDGARCLLAAEHCGDCRFCRCGPNEACSRCSTPRPVGVFFGQQYAEPVSGAPYATPMPVSPVLEQLSAPPPCTCDRAPGTYRHQDSCRLVAWMRAADTVSRTAVAEAMYTDLVSRGSKQVLECTCRFKTGLDHDRGCPFWRPPPPPSCRTQKKAVADGQRECPLCDVPVPGPCPCPDLPQLSACAHQWLPHGTGAWPELQEAVGRVRKAVESLSGDTLWEASWRLALDGLLRRLAPPWAQDTARATPRCGCGPGQGCARCSTPPPPHTHGVG